MVVLNHGPLPLVHLDGDGGQVDTGGLNTQRQERRVQEQEVNNGLGGVTGEDGGLHSVAIGHSLITVEMDLFLAVKEFRVKLLYIGDPGKASREDDVIDDRLKSQGPCSTRNLIRDKLLQEAAQ